MLSKFNLPFTTHFMLMMMLLFSANILNAGDRTWTTKGPYGGQIFCIVKNPLNPQILYAGSAGGLSKSIDGGNSWELILSEGIVKSPKKIIITQIHIDNTNPNRIIACCQNAGLYLTTNGGQNWEYLGFGNMNEQAWSAVSISSLSQCIYVSNNSYNHNIFYSEDNGQNWVDIGIEGSIGPLISDPFEPYVIYCAGQFGVYRRSYFDTEWTSISTGLPAVPDEVNISTLIADPITPGTIYAVSSGYGLYKTTDYGQTWSLLYSDIGSYSDYKQDLMAISTLDNNVIYAISGNQLLKTTDAGVSWNSILSTCKTLVSVEIIPGNPDVIYAGDVYNGILKSINGGENWEYVNKGLSNSLIQTIELDPSYPGTLYAGSAGGDMSGGFFKSESIDGEWIALNSGLTCEVVTAIAVNPEDSNIIWIGTSKHGLFKSTDGGLTWSGFEIGLSEPYKEIIDIIFDPLDHKIIYVAHKSELFKSVDGGANWALAGSMPDDASIKQLQIIGKDFSSLYVATGGNWSASLYKSIDGGINWYEVTNNSSIESFAVDPADENIIYYSSYETGLKKTVDGGLTWFQKDDGLGWYSPVHPWITSIIIDPDNHDLIYAGLQGLGGAPWGIPGGVYVTNNGGDSWEPMMDGLDLWDVRQLLYDRRDGNLYAAIGQGGVYSYSTKTLIGAPTIISINDVPDDQGKQVYLKWAASDNDNTISENPVTQYGIWRKIAANKVNYCENEEKSESVALSVTMEGWQAIASVLAVQEPSYLFAAPTLADSNNVSTNLSVFAITAHTQEPLIWICSLPDSGYSVDNIAPEPAFNLHGDVLNSTIALKWETNFQSSDFSYFAVYRDTIAGFVPQANNLLATCTENLYIDNITNNGKAYTYIVTCFDINGNESDFSNEAQFKPNGMDEDKSGFNSIISYPNPFTDYIQFDFPCKGMGSEILIEIYSAQGDIIRTISHQVNYYGNNSYIWDGKNNEGINSGRGIYIIIVKESDIITGIGKIMKL